MRGVKYAAIAVAAAGFLLGAYALAYSRAWEHLTWRAVLGFTAVAAIYVVFRTRMWRWGDPD